MFSGGKDSTYAIDHCLKQGWSIEYLLSVKPTRKDCYLFHFATVEHTPKQAEILGIKHILTTCDVADPKLEADIIKNIVEKNPVDALVLGGTGLQETQIKSLQDAMRPLGIEVFAAHAGFDHEDLFRDMIKDGYEIIVTQVAADGILPWLGKTITLENFDKLFADSRKYGFHIGFDGGPADSFVCSGPIFGKKKIIVEEAEKVVDGIYSGHMIFNRIKLVEMPILTDNCRTQSSQ